MLRNLLRRLCNTLFVFGITQRICIWFVLRTQLQPFRELRRYGAREHKKPRYNYRTINQEDNYMKSVLEELFYGNLCPNTDCRSKEKEVKELMGYIADHHDTLIAQLNEKQKEIFEKFDDCWDELTDINEREIFVYAFKLGMRIAIEVLSSDTD